MDACRQGEVVIGGVQFKRGNGRLDDNPIAPLIDQFDKFFRLHRVELGAYMIVAHEVDSRGGHAEPSLQQRKRIFAVDLLRVNRKIDAASIPRAQKRAFQANRNWAGPLQQLLRRDDITTEIGITSAWRAVS